MPIALVRYREFWGEGKRADLLATLDEDGTIFDSRYVTLTPSEANRFALRPGDRTGGYGTWVELPDLSGAPAWSGLLELRKGALMAHDLGELKDRMARYLAPTTSFGDVKALSIGPVEDAARFDPARARSALIAAGGLSAGRFARIALYPFDYRWCFHTNIRPVWNEPRPDVAAQQAAGNLFLATRAQARRPVEGYPVFATAALPGDHLLDPKTHPLPFVLHAVDVAGGLGLHGAVPPGPNLSPAALAWTTSLGLPPDADTSRLVWHHALAITYSPAYLAENAAGIRQGWPRIPLPGDADLLRASAALGARLAALLDADTPVPGVTTGAPDPALAAIAVPATRPGAAKDWRLTGWGHRSDKGVTMPGRGQASARPYAADEAATAAHAALLGARTLDIGMNGASFWKNVPEQVWETHIGGYQVLKKWLSYRDGSILKRDLKPEEVAHVQATARRLAAILLMGPALDASFRACATAHTPLPPPTSALTPP